MTQQRPPKRAVLLDALDQELRRRPRGTIRAMEVALGWAPTWWHNRLRSGDITTGQALAVLEYLGLDPAGFVRRNVTTELEVDRPVGPAPPIVVSAREKLLSKQDGPGLGKAFFEDLETRRHHDPDWALHTLEATLDTASRRELPDLLGIAAACLVARERPLEADHASFTALRAAHWLEDPGTVGRLLRRRSAILLDQLEYEAALEMADRAAGLLLRVNDFAELAKACLAQGLCLLYLNRNTEAIVALDSALERLPKSEPLFRVAAFNAKGIALERLGQLPGALDVLEQTRFYGQACAPRHEAMLLWLEARILRAMPQLEPAAILLRRVVQTLTPINLSEAALAAGDLAQVLILQGRGAEAVEVSTTALQLAEPMRDRPFVKAASFRLVRARQEGLDLARRALEGRPRRSSGSSCAPAS